MYDRNIDDTVYEFEPSGALYHSALVMMDRQTDSYWAMMSAKAIGGPKQETPLTELPLAHKTTWADWREQHPNTLVLIVDGKTHVDTKGKLTVEPLLFTLGIFKRCYRNNARAWRLLGYVPTLDKILANRGNADIKGANYHFCIRIIVLELDAYQQLNGID